MATQAMLRLGSIIVLARLLAPEDFGIAAMAGVLLNLVTLIGDWGLTAASTQRLSLSHDELSKLFWINCLVGLLLAATTALCAPLVALVFDERQVIAPVIVLSVTIVGIGLGAQHEALLRRRLEYTKLQLIRAVSHAVGVACGLLVGIVNRDFWALVAMQVSLQITRTTMHWLVSGWRPSWCNSRTQVSSIFRFASNLVPSTILFYFSRNTAAIMLGTMAGSAELGLYNRASVSVMTPLTYLTEPLERVVPASLSRLQQDPRAFERMFFQALMVTTFMACGMLALVAAEAHVVVAVLLGDQWHSTVPLVQWLTLAGATWVIGKVIGWLLVPHGRAGTLLRVRALRTAVSVAGVVVGWRWGTVGVVAGYSIATVASLVGEILFTLAVTRLQMKTVVKAIWRPVMAALAAAGLVLTIPSGPAPGLILAEVTLYAVVFISANLLLPGGWAFMRDLRRTLAAAVFQREHA